MRTEGAGTVGDRSGIEKWTDLYRHRSIAIHVLVGLPIREEVISSQRSTALAAIACTDVCPHGQIVVAFQSEHEEFIEGHGSDGLAGAELLLHLVVVSFRA